MSHCIGGIAGDVVTIRFRLRILGSSDIPPNEARVQLRVELPSGPLIEFLSLCKAIAQAVRPVRENGLKGIECIVGKVATHEILMDRSTGSLAWTLGTGFQGVLVSEDGRTHDQLIGGKYNGAEAVEPVLPLGETGR